MPDPRATRLPRTSLTSADIGPRHTPDKTKTRLTTADWPSWTFTFIHQCRNSVRHLHRADPEEPRSEDYAKRKTPPEPGIQSDAEHAGDETDRADPDVSFSGGSAMMLFINLIVLNGPDHFSAVVIDPAA